MPSRLPITALLLAIMAGCAPAGGQNAQEIDAKLAEIDARQAQLNATEARIENLQKKLDRQTTARAEPAGARAGPAAVTPEPDLCWQDYCPCAPPQGGADAGLCRQLRAGMHVDEDMLAAAAMARDARKQMEEFETEYEPM